MTAGGGEQSAFRLAAEKRMREIGGRRKWRYLASATNATQGRIGRMLERDLPETHKQRWRVENAYKSIREILPMASGGSHPIETFLAYFSMISCNARYASNRAADADSGELGRRPAKKRAALSKFMALMISFAPTIIGMDMDKRGCHPRCVK